MKNSVQKYDVLIAGTGVAGLCCALNLPRDMRVLMLTKAAADESDSFLAQGGICMLRGEEDFRGYFDDTLRAGHYENDAAAVEQMIRLSPSMIAELVEDGVEFARDEEGNFRFTREGGHSRPRILFHDDVTGKEITSKLLALVRALPNVEIREHAELVDIIAEGNECFGGVVRSEDGKLTDVYANFTLLATGGVGGLYENSTNFRHLTGDSLAIALINGVEVEHLDYVQIHPTTFYSEKQGRRFLISESVRGRADEKGGEQVRAAGYAPRRRKDDPRAFPHHLRPLPRRGVRRAQRTDPRRARPALFHGRRQGRFGRQNEHEAAVFGGGNGVQRRTRQKPPGEQFPARKPHMGGAGGKVDGGKAGRRSHKDARSRP